MGIFKKIGKNKTVKGFSKAVDKVADTVTDTFISPVAREAIRPFVNVRSGIDGLVPGGRESGQPVNTPFGEVKPFANVVKTARGVKQEGTLTSKEAAMGALEVATSGPGGVGKTLLKPFAKVAGKLDNVLGLSKMLKSSAAKKVGEALAPTTTRLKVATEKITPEFLERGMSGSLNQIIKKAQDGVQVAGRKLDEFGELAGSTDVNKVIGSLDDAKKDFLVNGVSFNKSATKTIDEIKKSLLSLADEGGQIGREHLRAVRRIWDDAIYQAGGFHGKTLKEGSTIAVQKIASDKIRNLLAEEVPDLAKINKEFNFFSNLLDIADATKTRRLSQTGTVRKGFGAVLGTMLGHATGLPGGEVVGMAGGQKLAAITGSTLFKSLDAKARNVLADALVGGEYSIDKIAKLFQNSAFSVLKASDLKKALDQDAKLEQKELEQIQQQQQERIDSLREILGREEPETTTQPPSQTSNQTMDAARKEELRRILGR